MSRTGYTCIRYVFCAVNIFLWLAGCGLLGLGTWLHYARQGRNSLLPQHTWAGGDIALIAIGAAIFVVTFFGCCGSCYQSKCMLVTYFVLVIIMFLFEFLIATFAFVYREQIHQTVQDEFLHGIENHYQYPDNGLDEIWDRIHTNLHCCGMKNYEDWYEIKSWPEEKRVPESCCLPQFSNSTDCFKESNQDKWYDKGCSEKLQMWLVSQLHLVGIVGLIVSFIQLFGLISAMLLFCTDREKRTKGHIYQPAV